MEDGGTALDPGSAQGSADDAYRGFLFADLRGYTSFVERHGDAAAADLLDAYRALVRDAVARFDGSEIRTEGDSFYVVFRSARRAVACALAIVAAVDEDRQAHPDRPIQVGIGINAGETVQRDEGFVGSAVNLAARVCAQARAGEVLVTAPVRDAVGEGAGLRFDPRGTRRLKGISRPVSLFAVRIGTAPTSRWAARPALRGAWLPISLVALAGAAAFAIAMIYRPFDGEHSLADSTVPSAAASSGTSASGLGFSGPSASGGYPTAAEDELLMMLGTDVGDHCERADDDDRPRIRVDPVTRSFFALGPREPIPVTAALSCEIPSFGAPDVVRFWSTQAFIGLSGAEIPRAFISNEAGSLDIPEGDCMTEAEVQGRWQVGPAAGWYLCRDEFGDALLYWSRDDWPVLALAMRRDGDHEQLMRWWSEEARLLIP